jgi:hypothetical protein
VYKFVDEAVSGEANPSESNLLGNKIIEVAA